MDLETQLRSTLKAAHNQTKPYSPARPLTNSGNVDFFQQTGEQQRQMHQLSKDKMIAEETLRNYVTYLSSNAHDLRNAFSVIIGYSEMFLDGMHITTGEDFTNEYAGSILSSSHYLFNLINDLVDLSKIDAAQLALHEELIDVKSLIKEVGSKMEERRKKANLSFNVSVAPNLPHIFLDDQRIQQAILNLLSNAIKFTLPGGQIDLSAFKNKAGCLEIHINDNGEGMNISAVPRALTNFGKATSGGEPCTGLGLPLAQRLVELHGGTLNLTSKLNCGTTIILTLPASRWQDQRQ